nr:alpha amylase C-terminal domain-containing protein [Opitutaceae bacterium]
YHFIVNRPVTVYLAVENHGETKLDAEWERTDLTLAWDGGTDRVYKRNFGRGTVSIPAHSGQTGGRHGIPHLAFVESDQPASLDIQIGMNLPILVRSQAIALERKAAAVPPGHWIYNPYWNSVALHVEEGRYDNRARILAFRRPNGKMTVVVSNRTANAERPYDIATGLPADTRWAGFRYTPDEAGPGTLGVPIGELSGSNLKPALPPRSWEFWEQL